MVGVREVDPAVHTGSQIRETLISKLAFLKVEVPTHIGKELATRTMSRLCSLADKFLLNDCMPLFCGALNIVMSIAPELALSSYAKHLKEDVTSFSNENRIKQVHWNFLVMFHSSLVKS